MFVSKGAASSEEPKKKKKRSEGEGEEAEARARKERESFCMVYVSPVSKEEILRKQAVGAAAAAVDLEEE
jgi:hypothetical protein